MNMSKWAIRAAMGITALAAIAVAVVFSALHLATQKRQRVIVVHQAPLVLPVDRERLEHGRHLFESRGCSECHGRDGAGRVFASDDHGLTLRAPDITSGAGGVTQHYQDIDWVRTIRHGIKPDGRPVFIMPSEDFARLSDADVGDIAAYAKQLAPVPGQPAMFRLPVMLEVLYGLGVIKDAAAKIDHNLPPVPQVHELASSEYGAYVAQMCMGCHGPTLTGGRLPGHPRNWPPAANLTPGPGSVLPRYPDVDSFAAMLRSGRRPDGSAVNPAMPFASLGALSDVDIKAVYLFLTKLPPRAAGHG